jgi:hypothetical protein
MSIEAGVLVGRNGRPLYWHMPRGASVVELPDSATLWDVIWRFRHVSEGFAHTHPGRGVPEPSNTDLTTFAAVEAGLGRRFIWWVLSEDKAISVSWDSTMEKYVSGAALENAGWMRTLRMLSLSGDSVEKVMRRQVADSIREQILRLPPDQRIEILVGLHFCLRCGEDLRDLRWTTDDGKRNVMRCTCRD